MRDPEAEDFLRPLPTDEWFSTWHLVLRDGRVVGRGAGLVELLHATRLTRPAARVVGLVPAALLEAFYGLVASQRARLGRLVPDGEAPRRFP